MKNLLKITFLLIGISSSAQIEVELFFKNTCDNSIREFEFELIPLDDIYQSYSAENSKTIVPKIGKYIIHGYEINDDGTIGSFYESKDILNSQKVYDTLIVPKILHRTSRTLHSGFSKYYYCDKPCNGYQVDFYANGNLKVDGLFKDGKPIEYSEYRNDGTKEFQQIYRTKREVKKSFDETGKLEETEITIIKKSRIIIKTYNADQKLVSRKVLVRNKNIA